MTLTTQNQNSGNDDASVPNTNSSGGSPRRPSSSNSSGGFMGGKGKYALAALVALVLAGTAFWYFVVREVAPVTVDSTEAAAARADAIDAQAGGDDGSAAAPAASAGDISGTWNVDTSIGQFNDACLTEVCSSTFAGFRIDEVLTGIGDKTVVGRTPGVAGQVSVDGTVINGALFEVDMTGLITDSGARTNAIRNQAIETSAFPTASFQLTDAIDLGSVPGDGQQVQVTATGELTVHGVTRTVSIPLTAELQSGVMVVFGQLELSLPDYDIDAPSAPVVASVEDTAILELQLFLTR